MSKQDLFRKPFDEGTTVKLKIFEDYFKEWLPVFIAKPNPIWKEIQIFDFFAGEGKDINDVPGSPLRILAIINDNRDHILKNGVKVNVIFNEFERPKYELLVRNAQSIVDRNICELNCYNEDFSEIFSRCYESMKATANFLFLDQNGIKQITEDIFSKLIQLKQTDLLFFISSSYIKRFAESEEFSKYLKITKQELKGKSYYHIHRIILNYYRNLVPSNKTYFLAPFSIKKPSGIYGLIFGTNHLYGLEKFLTVCWKHDGLTGEANYDIDNEKINMSSPSLFQEMNVPSKRQVFEENLRKKILEVELRSNLEVYTFSLWEGFLPKDANAILKELKRNNKISYDFKLASSKIHKQEISPIKII
ncbi:MAG TPA: three-Cys-motif partner protein TcmP [Cyclobacteriaceae bacterium]|nr:three-Cys-motif partner protein TcmP [Cyclobacteriaceae bacterium]